MSLVFDVLHDTVYRYGARVDIAYHLAHLRPRDDRSQRVLAHELHIEPQPAGRADSTDAFGNTRTVFTLLTPHESLRVRAASTVERVAAARLDPADSEPWEAVAASLRFAAGQPLQPAVEFSFASPFVPRHPELGAYAEPSFAPGARLLDGALDLMGRLHRDVTYEPGVTEVNTPVLDAFRARRGVCQDLAHMMIGCLRALGLPARYVSGYLLTTPPPGQPRLLGADASHAWVSVWCPSAGWVDLDPTNDCLAGGGHVVLAVGRDYGDVMPLRGVIRGGGEHALEVGVSVIPA